MVSTAENFSGSEFRDEHGGCIWLQAWDQSLGDGFYTTSWDQSLGDGSIRQAGISP